MLVIFHVKLLTDNSFVDIDYHFLRSLNTIFLSILLGNYVTWFHDV